MAHRSASKFTALCDRMCVSTGSVLALQTCSRAQRASCAGSKEPGLILGICWLRAGFVAMQVLLLSLLFTGYLVNIAAVTPVLQWVHYLSVFFFGFESLIVNEMSGISLIFSVSISSAPLLQRPVTLVRSAKLWDVPEASEHWSQMASQSASHGLYSSTEPQSATASMF